MIYPQQNFGTGWDNTNDSGTSSSSGVTQTIYYVIASDSDFIEKQSGPSVKDRPGKKGDFVVFGGKIVAIWNSRYSKWNVWYQPVKIKTKGVIVNKRKRWFAGFVGHNRGRHWDRKRR